MATKKEDTKTTKVLEKKATPEETSTAKVKKAPAKVATTEKPVIKKRATPDESSSPKEKKSDSPLLKKRELPTDKEAPVEKKSESPLLKKRELPTDKEAPVEKKNDSPLLKKRELPTEQPKEKETTGLKKKANPLEKISNKSEEKEEAKNLSSLDKMRERIAAQKKLEQDMMTQQVLRNQEKEGIRSKLNKLSKEFGEEEQVEQPKTTINFDLKSEALETQNKKLKQDLEKLKNQLQALLNLEFMDLKVLDPYNLTLANEFVEAVNNIKDQVELQKDKEEQSLKDELQSLQYELDNLRAKNEEAKKASTDIKRVAQQTQKALDQAKKAIQEQETDEVRDFKQEITNLQEQLKIKEQEIEKIQNEKIALKKNNEESLKVLKASLEKQIKELTAQLDAKESELKNAQDNSQKQLNEQSDKVNTLLMQYQKQLDEKDKDIDELRQTVSNQEKINKEAIDEKEVKIEELSKLVEEKNQALSESVSKEVINEKDAKIEELNKLVEEKNQALSESVSKEVINEKNAKIEELNKLVEEKNQALSESVSKEVINEKDAKIEELNKLVEEKNQALASSITKDIVLEKDAKIEELNKIVKEKESQLLEISKQSSKEEIKALEEKCNQYQTLLLSERDSHLQVEQRLCKDLDSYKQEIVSLQGQITNMSSDYGLTRLHSQIDSIEAFINEMKSNPDNINKNAYNEYYEKLIVDYKLEEEKLLSEINRRNQMLQVIKQEKIKVIEVLRKNGKSTLTIEKQIKDIDDVLNSKFEPSKLSDSKEIEAQILNKIKEDLLQYCDNVKNEASKELEKIDAKYNSSKTVSDLVNKYNNDFERMSKAFGQEISKLNIERSLSNDANVINAIEEKMLMIEKQYKINTAERDRKFNDSIAKLHKQSLEIVKEEMVNPYISVVGQEYIKCINQYAEMKKNILDKLEFVKKQYNDDVEKIKEEETGLLTFNESIKESVADLNSHTELTEEDAIKKKELLSQLKINEEKINNLYQYGYNVLKQETDDLVKKLEAEFASIIEDENRLRDLYAQREQEAKSRLEIEKAKEDQEAQEKAIKQYNEYRYIEEEADRIIESVQERRERIHEQKIAQIEPKHQVVQEQAPSEVVKEEPKNVISSDINAIDYAKIKELQDQISALIYKQNELNAKQEEMMSSIERYNVTQKQSTSHREIKKYVECVKEYYALGEKVKALKQELEKIDEKTNKKEYKAKRAELKSLDNKIVYYAKQIKSLNKKEIVNNYSKVSAAIKELKKNIEDIEKEKANITLEINKCELAISTLKQNN